MVIRFVSTGIPREGLVVGEKLGSKSFLEGSCRALWPWRTLNLDAFLGLGTHLKYYIESGEGYYDITP